MPSACPHGKLGRCPWGSAWDGLYKLLPHDAVDGRPSPPLILAGWYASSNLDKALRLREHIERADQHGVLDTVDKYLRGLEPGVWHRWQNSTYV